MIKKSKIFVNSQNICQKTGINILVNPTVGLAFYQNLNKYPWLSFFLLAPRNSGHTTEDAELKHLLNDRTLYSSSSKTDKFVSQHSFKFLPCVQPSSAVHSLWNSKWGHCQKFNFNSVTLFVKMQLLIQQHIFSSLLKLPLLSQEYQERILS